MAPNITHGTQFHNRVLHLISKNLYSITVHRGTHKRETGTAWLQPQTNQNLRTNMDFVIFVISNVLYDLPFSQNQPLHLADELVHQNFEKENKRNVYVSETASVV